MIKNLENCYRNKKKKISYCGICAEELYYGDIAYAFIEGTIIDKNYDGWKDFGKDFAPLIDVVCKDCWSKILKKITPLTKVSTEQKSELKAKARKNGFVFRVKHIEDKIKE